MERRTSRYIIGSSLAALLCLLAAAMPVHAQEQAPPKPTVLAPTDSIYPLYNGVDIGVDLWGVGGSLLGSDFLSSEVVLDVNLKNRFFPVLELGYGRTDTWNDNGTHYRSAAPYVRVGMDYNVFFKKKARNYLFVGLRYAVSSFTYDVTTLAIDDPVYGGGIGNPNQTDDVWGGSIPFDHPGLKGSMQWMEIVLGLRAHIWRSWHMGWALRMRYRTTASASEFGNPWYVPGFGKYASSTLGVTYTITYKLPF